MDRLPQAFWALLLVGIAGTLGTCALYSVAEKDIRIAIIGLSSNIVAGALGYISNHRLSSDSKSGDQPKN